MRNLNVAIIFFAIIFFSFSAQAKKKETCVSKHNAKTISLYKEIRALRGLLYNFTECGWGACAPAKLQTWYFKVKKHWGKSCNDGFAGLQTSTDEYVYAGDLYDIPEYWHKDRGIAMLYKFEIAMLCYENPKICKKHK